MTSVFERDKSEVGEEPAIDVVREIFPDGMEAWCADRILLAVVNNADRYGIATGNVTVNGKPEPLGIEELARQADVPLAAAKQAIGHLEATHALSRFEHNGSDVWVLADPEDDLAAPGLGRKKCPEATKEGQ